jgi:hypothetical protein
VNRCSSGVHRGWTDLPVFGIIGDMGSLDRGRRERARRRLESARTERVRVEREADRIIASRQQRLIDVEVQETRRTLLRSVRHRSWNLEVAALLDEDFLTVADRQTVIQAVINIAVTATSADMCALQTYDRDTHTLRIEGHHGFPSEFLAFFGTIGEHQAGCACASALTNGRPVLVNDITRSSIFTDQQTLDLMRAAGSRAVHSFPLVSANGTVSGVLSLHYRKPGPARGPVELVVAAAAQAVARVTSLS